ncbi:MFS transporter [Kitasatospora sp. NPDC049285]|uniref:MFS transporter n=1 Tax=Kitasatospora sp. NPDC049285 TaxID=3157096 RepID=UPI00344818B1
MTTAAAEAEPTTTRPSNRLPATYWVLVIGFGVSRIGAVLVPYLTLYLVTQLHLSIGTAGQVLAAFGAGWVLGQPLSGVAADRFGRKSTIVVSLALTAAAYGLLAAATTVTELVVLAIAIGLVFDAPRTAITAWIGDVLTERQRARGFGLQYWMLNAGAAVAGIVGGYLASAHMGWLCAVDALTCVVFALVILALPATRDQPVTASDPVRYRSVLADRRLLTFTGLSLATLTVYQQMVYGIPLAIHASGLSPAVYGAVNVANAVTVLALQPLLQPLMDRSAPLRTTAAGALAIGLGMGANGLAHSATAYVAAAAVWTLGEMAFCVGAAAYVTELAPDGARGRYLGVWGAAFGGSALAAPLLGALALDNGPGWLWTGSTVLASACAAVFALQPANRRPARG